MFFDSSGFFLDNGQEYFSAMIITEKRKPSFQKRGRICYEKQKKMARLGPGDLFGEIYACLPQTAFDGTAKAITDTDILFLDLSRVVTTCSSACPYHPI